MGDATIGVGVIGLGFIGRMHVQAYASAAAAGLPCELVAVCDADEGKLRDARSIAGNIQGGSQAGAIDFSRARGFANPDALLGLNEVQLVSICTWTDTHVELAMRALAAGKHVLVEKPVGRTSAEVEQLSRA